MTDHAFCIDARALTNIEGDVRLIDHTGKVLAKVDLSKVKPFVTEIKTVDTAQWIGQRGYIIKIQFDMNVTDLVERQITLIEKGQTE